MFVTFTFDYGVVLTEAQAALLRPLVRGEPTLIVENDPDTARRWWTDLSGDLTAILSALPELTKKIKLVDAQLTPNGLELLSRQLREIKERLDTPAPKFNERLQVVVPSFGMLLIDEVQVLEDCCTTRLQEALDDRWRILAVCPQDARRPDYVLGRDRLARAELR